VQELNEDYYYEMADFFRNQLPAMNGPMQEATGSK
jgi:hypothetical protein